MLAPLLAVTSFASAQPSTPVGGFELDRLTGGWYEVARLPNRRERSCVSDNMVLYALGDKRNTIQIVTSCEIKGGNSDAWNDKGKTSPTAPGHLKLSRLLLFSSKYWVLAIGDDYQWALVGSPNHKSLWLLTRAAKPDPQTIASIQAKAGALGFDTSKLIHVSQHN